MTIQSQLDQVLAPCPFCGSADVRVFGDKPDESMIGGYNVICGNPNCQATCRHSGDRSKSIAAWNSRAAVGGEAVGFVELVESEWRFSPLSSVSRDMHTMLRHGIHLYASPPATVDVGALRTLLADDALANEVAGRCRDKDHDDRWCPTCSSRSDGIEDYRDELAALIGEKA